jgi:hypothetical protein
MATTTRRTPAKRTTTKRDAAETVTVVTRGKRTVFEGPLSDARTYVENNFPRLHVEPGSTGEPEPDAVIVAPNGTTTYWNGSEHVNPKASKSKSGEDED